MPRPRLPERPSLVSILAGASEQDLEEIQERIRALEQEVDSLKVVEKALDIRLNGRATKRVGRKPKAEATNGHAPLNRLPLSGKGETTSTHRMKVVEYLKRVGAAKPAVICNDCDIPKGSITAVLDHEEFKRGVDGFVKLA